MEKKSEKIKKKIAVSDKKILPLKDRLETAVEGLVYISEIDARFTVVEFADDETIIAEIEKEGEVEEVGFTQFFERLTRKGEWFGERETARAKKFLDLQKLIEESLTDLRVLRLGRIKLRILIVGHDPSGRILGLETRAIET